MSPEKLTDAFRLEEFFSRHHRPLLAARTKLNKQVEQSAGEFINLYECLPKFDFI